MRKLIIMGTALALSLAFAATASADSSSTTFESFSGSNINQGGWMCTGCAPNSPGYDVSVVPSGVPGLGKSMRISNVITSGSFGDQTLSPGLQQPASSATGAHHTFDGQFTFYAANYQAGRQMSVSPDNGLSQGSAFGPGGRMSYLRFEDHQDGVHVIFTDGTFVAKDIAKLSYGKAHQVRFLMTVKRSPDDQVKVFLDGKQSVKGTTWEGYYENDPEAAAWQNAGITPNISNLIFLVRSSGGSADAGTQGYLIDNVQLKTSN